MTELATAHSGARPNRRFVIVVRADPVICGHSGEARNLAEAARTAGFDDIRIVTWPLAAIEAAGLPRKPADRVLPYGPGITVERPEPVGDYKVPDGRYVSGIVGRLVELFTDDVPTVVMSLYLVPHATAVMEAVRTARAMGHDSVTTVAEAVGSDITNAVRSAVTAGQFGAAAYLFTTYLAHDHPVAVSAYTKKLIVEAAETVDAAIGTVFADTAERRIAISYPAVHTDAFVDLDRDALAATLDRRGLESDRYLLFLSRITDAKGVDDLIDAYRLAACRHLMPLVIAGTGPSLERMRAKAAEVVCDDGRFIFLDDVDDEEKVHLMASCSAYVLPSKPRPEFVETFGIALVEKMLAGGGPVVTTETGGIPEAVGDTAAVVPVDNPRELARAIDEVVLDLAPEEREAWADKARAFALQFDRGRIFDVLLQRIDGSLDGR